MDTSSIILSWAASAPRGEKIRAARALGTSPQFISALIARARRGVRSPATDRLAAWICAASSADDAVASVVRPAGQPMRLDDLVDQVVAITGAPADQIAQHLRASFATFRNFGDQHEYVFAVLVADDAV
jgi:hypothetical protein